MSRDGGERRLTPSSAATVISGGRDWSREPAPVDVKSGPDMISSERRRALLEQLSESASYCRVFENIWIGDIGSAAGAASGAITTFRGVLNASGKESKGISFAPEYEARKIAYETLFDPETGMTLADSKAALDVETVAAAMNKHHDLVPSVMFDDDSRARSEKSRGRARMTPAHSTQTSTDTAFIYFMHSAVAKIDKLIAYADKNGGGGVLVHCYAGVNRSASAIVAYMMMRRGIPFVDAATSVAEIVLARRRVPALTNARFKALLEKTFPTTNAADAEKAYRAEHRAILSRAKELHRESEARKASRKQAIVSERAQKGSSLADVNISVGAEFDADFSDPVGWEFALTEMLSDSARGMCCSVCGSADVGTSLMYCKDDRQTLFCSRSCQIESVISRAQQKQKE